MSYYLRYEFFPVGQGLFAAGMLCSSSNNTQKIRWVYDCGTSSKSPPNLINNAIKSLEESLNCETVPNAPRPKLNLVAISHFDEDHISEMSTLLSQFDVEILLLPYMPLSQRLMLAFEEGIKVKDSMMQFFVNPVQYVNQIVKTKIEKIVLVPASSGSGPTKETGNNEGRRNEELLTIEKIDSRDPIKDDEKEDKEIFKDKVLFLKEHAALRISGIWEFVPYNDVGLAREVSESFRKAVARERTALISNQNKKDVDEALIRLKDLYDQRFGSISRKRNMISLFLYGGPINSKVFGPLYPFLCEYLVCCFQRSRWHHYETLLNTGRCSILYTGDGYLDIEKRIKAMQDYLGQTRIDKLHTLQVMHHGAKKNCGAGVAKRLNPVVSVFCADPSYKYKHPYESVLREFVSHRPILVDKDYGITINFCFE